MKRSLEDYRHIVGDEVIARIHRKVLGLLGKHILHINSTYQGGGVAEMLHTLVPLMNDIGLDAGWRILHGSPDFFSITKRFHNGLQGQPIHMTEIKKQLYTQTSETFSYYTHIEHDFVVVHDPQPLPLLKFYKKQQPWVWRCHIDLSNPDENLWEYLKTFILKYDTVIVSSEKYRRVDLPVEYKIMPPAIDPLSPKNRDIDGVTIRKTLARYNIPMDKPILTQISRFDKWKDPEGVINIFQRVKQKVDCRLVLCGSMAADDPEGWEIYENINKTYIKEIENGDILLVTSESNILVNALQRAASVIIQKSTREGFGLTVTEGLWKGKPVLASNVGGIPLQISDGENGCLLDPQDIQGFAERTIELMKDETMAIQLGKNARESVREKFLITRLLADYLDLFHNLLVCSGTCR